MARNKPLTEAPPEPESSSDHEDPSSGSSTEPDEPNTAEPEVSSAASSTEDEEDDDGEEEEEEQTPTPHSPFTSPSKKPTAAAAAVTTTRKPPSSSEEESSSDDDNDAPVAELKSITKPASKPSTEPVSSPKPRPKPAVAAEKRPSENNEKEKPSSKRPKKDNKSPPGPGTGTEEGSRKSFQRVFSEEDETEILKGLIEFKDRKGGDPLKNVDEALGFVRKRVHVEVNKTQMVDKLRRLKKKFATAGRKKSMSDHDKKLFELSKKIWNEDDDGGELKVNDNFNGGGVIVKENKNVGGGKLVSKNRNSKSGKGENLTVTTIQNGPIVDYNAVVSFEGKKKSKEESEGDGMDEDFRVGEDEVKEVLRMEALERMGEKGRAEIREMWRKVEIAQMEVDVLRNEARVEEQRRIREALGFVKR